MFKQGKIEIEVFIVLITMVFTSAMILLLVYSGTIEVKEGVSSEPVLNAEFLPAGREGVLAIKDFDFCSYVDEQYGCQNPQEAFLAGEEIHFRFLVQSSTFNGQIALIENYLLKDPLGNIILEVDGSSDVPVEATSSNPEEFLFFRDYFVIHPGSPEGEYTLELELENTLLLKKITAVEKFIFKYGEDE